MIFLTKEIVDRIIMERKNRGLTLKQLAEKSGVNYATISRIECNIFKKTRKENLIKILDALEINIDTVLQSHNVTDDISLNMLSEQEKRILSETKELNIVLNLYLKQYGEDKYLKLKEKVIMELFK